jgi:hypothetical protein
MEAKIKSDRHCRVRRAASAAARQSANEVRNSQRGLNAVCGGVLRKLITMENALEITAIYAAAV